MPPDRVQATVLCEDLQAWVFARRMLIALGHEPRRIRVVPYRADGRGSGEQHVRERYPERLIAHRAQAARAKTVLIVHTDADRFTVEERFEALARELSQRGIAPRGSSEAVALLLPKREIETWIHFYLDGPPVDEERDYPKYERRESACWPAAEAFARHARDGAAPAQAPPSLVRGLGEARRIA